MTYTKAECRSTDPPCDTRSTPCFPEEVVNKLWLTLKSMSLRQTKLLWPKPPS